MKTIDIRKIKCIIYDFDGVMTDNCVIVSETGEESVKCNRSDGLAVAKFKKSGIIQAIVSTEHNKVVSKRAEKLKIVALQSVDNKAVTLKKYCEDNFIDVSEVLYVGNDINDVEAMLAVGFRGCPADAEKEVIEIADWISKKNGGEGVIRDLLSLWIDDGVIDI